MTTYSCGQIGQLLSEGGLWPDDTVNFTYQNRLRKGLSLAYPSGSPWTEQYGYDDASRLISAESPAGTFGYTYDPVKLQRVDELSLPNGADITNTFDSVARLLSTALVTSSGTALDSQNYGYNVAGQRTSETNTAGDFRDYSYDNEGELTSSIGYEPGGSYRFMDLRVYNYDAAGNMLSSRNLHGVGLQAYSYNGLNEMTNTTGTAAIPVSGSTTTPATSVTVNGTTATLYADNSFYTTMGVSNGLNSFTAIASDADGNWSTNTSTVNVVQTNGAYLYDANGNMLSDGYKNFAYDDENELIAVWVNNTWSNSFAYDGKMRRRIERDFSWQGGAWVETNEVHFIYDGNVVVEERNANNVPLVSYTRANDLSGSLQGAGGIGGLLARTTYGQELPGAPSTAFYHADGNGNIIALIYPNQQLAAKYLYDPFGNMLAMSGPLMNFNKYRFSSKEWEGNAGLYYYGYRFYDPSLQRWVNRDPLGEINLHGLWQSQRRIFDNEQNLYEFDMNSPTFQIDSDGRFAWVPFCCLACAGFGIWDVVDSIQEKSCAYPTVTETDECLLGKLLGNQLGGCVLNAIVNGIGNRTPVNQVEDNVYDCFKCEGNKSLRDIGKALSCGCCMGALGNKILSTLPPLPAPE